MSVTMVCVNKSNEVRSVSAFGSGVSYGFLLKILHFGLTKVRMTGPGDEMLG
jgi:hypothetical protein